MDIRSRCVALARLDNPDIIITDDTHVAQYLDSYNLWQLLCKKLSMFNFPTFMSHLCEIMSTQELRMLFLATDAQKSEALLKTFAMWVESEKPSSIILPP
jgi:5'-3' exonuclease